MLNLLHVECLASIYVSGALSMRKLGSLTLYFVHRASYAQGGGVDILRGNAATRQHTGKLPKNVYTKTDGLVDGFL